MGLMRALQGVATGYLSGEVDRMAAIKKHKLENIALQNALAGAIQQCDDFLKRLDDDVSDEG